MKVGEYVRTKDGIIDKVIIEYNGYCASRNCNCEHVSCEKNYYDEDKIIKSSPNIIDLIEAGDYVNGEKVCAIGENSGDFYIRDLQEFILAKDIKSIVTKEAFERMKYRIEE